MAIDSYAHLKWAENVARKYWRKLPRSVPLEDCVQEARLAVFASAKRWRKKWRVSFKAYCYHRIIGGIRDWLRDSDCTRRRRRNNIIFIPFSAMYTAHFRIAFPGYDCLDNYLYTKENPHTILENKDSFNAICTTVENECHQNMLRQRIEHSWTMKEIAEDSGLSESRISQIFKSVFADIRRIQNAA